MCSADVIGFLAFHTFDRTGVVGLIGLLAVAQPVSAGLFGGEKKFPGVKSDKQKGCRSFTKCNTPAGTYHVRTLSVP